MTKSTFPNEWLQPLVIKKIEELNQEVSCAKIEETLSEYSNRQIYYVTIVCYGYKAAHMLYQTREGAETVLKEVIVKAMEESDK